MTPPKDDRPPYCWRSIPLRSLTVLAIAILASLAPIVGAETPENCQAARLVTDDDGDPTLHACAPTGESASVPVPWSAATGATTNAADAATNGDASESLAEATSQKNAAFQSANGILFPAADDAAEATNAPFSAAVIVEDHVFAGSVPVAAVASAGATEGLAYVATPRIPLTPSLAPPAPAAATPPAAPAPTKAALVPAPTASTSSGALVPARANSPSDAVAAAAAAAVLLPLLGAALYHRVKDSAVLENATRKKVFEAVCTRPGIGIEDAAVAAGITYSTATYHLERLVASGMIVVDVRGRERRYFQNGAAFSGEDRRILNVLKQPETLRVLVAIAEMDAPYRAALAERLGVTHTTVNWHLKRLADTGLLSEEKRGRRAFIRLDVAKLRAIVSGLAPKLEGGDPTTAEAARSLLATTEPAAAAAAQTGSA